MKKISVGFLVFNENDNLQQTIRQAYTNLKKKISNNFDIWVFDNSNDASSTTIENLSAEIKELRLYKQKMNVGYAQNLNSAIKKMEAEYIFVIDGDGQYDVSDIENAMKLLKENDVIFGIRKPRRDPFIRILMSYFLGLLSKIILNSKLHDINCGFGVLLFKLLKKLVLIIIITLQDLKFIQ